MTGSSRHLVEISGDAGLRAAPEIAGKLRDALAEHDTVCVATAAITAADLTTIQLLLAARKQAQASQKSLSLASPPSGALRDLLIATGCLSPEGQPLTPDGGLWAPHSQNEETPA